MAIRSFLCIDPGERLLRAVAITVDGSSSTVERALVASVPSDVLAPEGDMDDVEAYGRWIAETLRRGGLGQTGNTLETILTLDREQATIRRLDLPTTDPDELPDMARLAMQRETPAEAGAMTVDLVPREVTGAATTVLIAAAPQSAVDRARRLAAAIGRPGALLSLRAFGMAKLLADAGASEAVAPVEGQTGNRAWLAGFDSSGECAELLVLRDGELMHSRGVRVADHAAAVSEAKRSWMGYRLAQPDAQVAGAMLFAPPSIHAVMGEALGRTVVGPMKPFTPPVSMRVAASIDAEALGHVWPLVGLALERAAGEETIDLAAPRKAPDFAARRRMRVIAGAGVLILAGLGGWTLGNMSYLAFEEEVRVASKLATSKLPEFHRFNRDENKLAHLRAWESAAPEWLEEARMIHSLAPDSTKVVLDSFWGQLEASDVQLDREKQWRLSADIKISIAGEAKDRATADALREALIESGRFTLGSPTADTEGGRRLGSPFTYVLRAKATPDASKSAAGSAAGKPSTNGPAGGSGGGS